MGLVLYALKYRVSFFVLSIIMLLGGLGSAVVTKKDVLPVVDIPGGRDRVDLYRSRHDRHGKPHHHVQRVRPHQQREQYQASGKPDVAGHDDREGLFRLAGVDRSRHRAGRVLGELDPRRHADGRSAAGRAALLRLVRAGHSAGAVVADPERCGALRLCDVPHPPDALDDARRHLARALWRIAASDPGRSRPSRPAGQRPDADRRHQLDRQPEHRRPVGSREVRQHPVPDPPQRGARAASPTSTRSRSRSSTASRSWSATSPMSATGRRRSRTSSARTARRPF